MVQRYELIALLSERLSPEAVADWQAKLHELITARGGMMLSSSNMGRRALSYRIRRRDTGYEHGAHAIVAEFDLPGNEAQGIHRGLTRAPDVLRTMLTKAKPHEVRRDAPVSAVNPQPMYHATPAPVHAVAPTPTPAPAAPAEPISASELDKRLDEILDVKEL